MENPFSDPFFTVVMAYSVLWIVIWFHVDVVEVFIDEEFGSPFEGELVCADGLEDFGLLANVKTVGVDPAHRVSSLAKVPSRKETLGNCNKVFARLSSRLG